MTLSSTFGDPSHCYWFPTFQICQLVICFLSPFSVFWPLFCLRLSLIRLSFWAGITFSRPFLSPEGRDREIIKRLPYVRTSVRSSRFCINLNISFIYEHIFTKFAGNVYGYKNLSLKNFSLTLKNKMAAIANCFKILKVL